MEGTLPSHLIPTTHGRQNLWVINSLVALLGPTVESDQRIAVRWPGPQQFLSKTRMSNHFVFETS